MAEVAPMPVLVTVALRFKPGAIDAFWRDVLPGLQAETRRFPGVLSAHAFRKDGTSGEGLFVDVFESEAAGDAYFAWRRSAGDFGRLEAIMIEPPRLDIWPMPAGDVWTGSVESSKGSHP